MEENKKIKNNKEGKCCHCDGQCEHCIALKEHYEEEVKNLVNTIDKVEDEKLVVKEQLAGALADYQNLEKKMAERINLRTFQTKKSLCEQLLPSLDSMTLAINASNELELEDKAKAWLDGIKATMQSIEKSLNSIGLNVYIPELGSPFDPNAHEALANVESKNVQKGSIVEVVQPGYTLDGVVIRHARVIVSK